jgi:hypothetical protein
MQAMKFLSGSMVVRAAAVLRACCRRTDPSCKRVPFFHSRKLLTITPYYLDGNMVPTLRSGTTTTGTTLPTLSGSNNLQALASVQRVALPVQPARSKSQNNLLGSGRTSLRPLAFSTRRSMLPARVMLASTSLVSTLKMQRRRASLIFPHRHRRQLHPEE